MIPPVIKDVWVILAIDRETGRDEGIPAMVHDGLLLPLVAADPDRISWLRKTGQKNAAAAAKDGKRLILSRFSAREDLETFEP